MANAAVAGLGDALTPDGISSRSLARHQAELTHELTWALKEAHVANLGDECHPEVQSALGRREVVLPFRMRRERRQLQLFVVLRIVQFTATPFRLDTKLVDGRVIFNYPLAAAQRDRYFKKITFLPVFELDPNEADEAIAREALRVLRDDIRSGLRHLLMARCRLIARGTAIKAIYDRLAPEFNALVVDSEMEDSAIEAALDRVRAGESRIVVCVNMLGEGLDLPELKIAALHDLHKSLPILLQFTGALHPYLCSRHRRCHGRREHRRPESLAEARKALQRKRRLERFAQRAVFGSR